MTEKTFHVGDLQLSFNGRPITGLSVTDLELLYEGESRREPLLCPACNKALIWKPGGPSPRPAYEGACVLRAACCDLVLVSWVLELQRGFHAKNGRVWTVISRRPKSPSAS